MGDVVVFVEYQADKVKKTSLELLTKAKELAGQLGTQVSALLVGAEVKGLADQVGPYGAQQVTVVESPKLAQYNAIAYAKVTTEAIRQMKPKIVLATASTLGKDLFPRVAARLQAGLSSDTTDLKLQDGHLVAIRPVYSGKAFVEVEFRSLIQIAITRPNSFPVGQPVADQRAEVVSLELDPGELRCALREIKQGSVGRTDLTEAEIIISGGRAMANSENFKILHECADVLGATVGASRAAVDSGYAGHDMQVGQTGKVVNPKLYIACGISGAIQHLAGMRTSKVIVAINKDPEAPIFGKADYGIVGDLFEVVPKLTEALKQVLHE